MISGEDVNAARNTLRSLMPLLIGTLSTVVMACGSGGEPAEVPTRGPIVTPTPTTVAEAPEPTPTGVPAQQLPLLAPPEPLPTQQPPEAFRPQVTPLDEDIGFAPELVGISAWINSDPISVEAQQGKVLLLHLFSYTNDMWLRTVPKFKEWREKYGPHGLVTISVHSPEFSFEKDRANLDAAVAKHGLDFPIAVDNDLESWAQYGGIIRPTMYIVDKNGRFNSVQFGDGGYQEVEGEIRDLLTATGSDLSSVPISGDPDPKIVDGAFNEDFNKSLTRRLYTGTTVNYEAIRQVMTGNLQSAPPYIQHRDYYQVQNSNNEYTDDPNAHINQYLYLNGRWFATEESLDHIVDSPGYDDYLAFRFLAKGVNVVMGNAGEPHEVRITMDGRPLKPEQAGADIQFDADGNSYVLVDRPDLYDLVALDSFSEHELQLRVNKAGISVYGFAFHAFENFP